MEHEKYSQKRIEAIKRFCLHVCGTMLRSPPCSPQLFASHCMPARYCLTKGGKFWKFDRYERDLTLYLVSVGDTVDNFLQYEDEMEASLSLEATPEMASLFTSAPNMSLSEGPLQEPQAPALPPRGAPKRKRAEVDKIKQALGCKF